MYGTREAREQLGVRLAEESREVGVFVGMMATLDKHKEMTL